MQALFALDNSTVNNGATIIVPGSHKSDEYAIQDPINAKYLELDLGDIAVWDSRLWHGALPNQSGQDRWAIVATFTRWWIKQNYQNQFHFLKNFRPFYRLKKKQLWVSIVTLLSMNMRELILKGTRKLIFLREIFCLT